MHSIRLYIAAAAAALLPCCSLPVPDTAVDDDAVFIEEMWEDAYELFEEEMEGDEETMSFIAGKNVM